MHARYRLRTFIKLLLTLACFLVILLTTGYLDISSSPQLPGLHAELLSENTEDHPVLQLTELGERRFRSKDNTQSTSFNAAVREYNKRYKIPPPPHFYSWYLFARSHDTRLIDEYDSIHQSLQLLWSLTPHQIRERTRDALSHNNSLLGISIRQGVVNVMGNELGQGDWQAKGIRNMISKFVKWLPDMELAFNVNDEPRILIPYEEKQRMAHTAQGAMKLVSPLKAVFSPARDGIHDLGNTGRTSFKNLSRQSTWPHARLACSIDTPAGSPNDTHAADIPTTFSYQGLDFVHNVDAFSDVCLAPSVQHSIGLFKRPNVFSVSSELIPIFSTAKIPIFSDILYPSPFYYANMTEQEPADADWETKIPKLYWRGTSSGGYSEGGIWKTMLRESIVSKLMRPGPATILEKLGGKWRAKSVAGRSQDRYDARFTRFKKCTEEDCRDMQKFFGISPARPMEDTWKYRYLLDMDGYGMRGRFHAFLKSKSLPLKVAYFREWHDERLFPWKHYVPLSADTDEYAEILRYFEEDDEGRQLSQQLALEGRDWSHRVTRNVDMETYMFRLLLEYGRLVDDHRQQLGVLVEPEKLMSA